MVLSMMWIVPGIILLGAMVLGMINLWIKQKREKQNLGDSSFDSSPQF